MQSAHSLEHRTGYRMRNTGSAQCHADASTVPNYGALDTVDDVLRDAERCGFVEELRNRLIQQPSVSPLVTEAISRVFSWVSDGRTMEDRGFRSTVAIYSVRSDLFGGVSLEAIGESSGRTKQAVWNLQEDFRRTMGLEH